MKEQKKILKFTLTNAYAATMLGWGLLEYQDGVKEIGELTEYKNNLAWALDYVASCDLGDEIGFSRKRKLSMPFSLSATAKKLFRSLPSTRTTRQYFPSR